MTYDVILSDLFKWLENYEGPRFHAVLSDPPYSLISITKRYGKEGSAPAQEGSDGRFSRLSGGFMGQKWDGFDSLEHYQTWVSKWAKLLIEKALYPGAVCLFFGGTRTFHHLGVGLERGGFEIVDCLMWLHGQGFPKSHDISKGMDKAAGAEREVVGTRDAPGYAVSNVKHGAQERTKYEFPEYSKEAVTEDAEQWQGYGTALKPAWEPIFLCRAPRGGKTFAQLAVEYGSGALNIDGGRISGNVNKTIQGRSERIYGGGQGFAPDGNQQSQPSPSGRWPANLLLSHHEDCVKIGEFEVDGRIINRFNQGMMPFGNADGEEYESEQMPPETVERWACVKECPIRQLDDQAGNLTSGKGSAIKRESSKGYLGMTYGIESREAGTPMKWYGDIGGPSRFFYCSKASRAEKDKGLEDYYWRRTDKGFERITADEYAKLPKRERAKGCIHPTVKPLDITRYLATMILPPSGDEPRRILIPFSGSGSEIIGAAQAGWDHVVGIEFEEQYVEIAKDRIRGNLRMFAGEIK